MTTTKNKSVIAKMIMLFFLIATIALAATGAWFTDSDNYETGDLSFAAVDISVKDGTISATNKYAELTGSAMPGSTVNASFTVTNSNSDVWLRYKLEVLGPTSGQDGSSYVNFDLSAVAGYNSKDGYVYVQEVCAKSSETKIEFTATIDKTIKNVAQNKSFKAQLSIEALQKANTGDSNSSSIWEGVTVETV